MKLSIEIRRSKKTGKNYCCAVFEKNGFSRIEFLSPDTLGMLLDVPTYALTMEEPGVLVSWDLKE